MQHTLTSYIKSHKYLVGMVVVLAVAAFMRFYLLDALPPGLHPDEAANGLDVLNIIEHHNFQAFYPRNGGREGLFFIIQAFFVWIMGNTTLALRVAPALIGVLSVGATYLWAKSWFGQRTGFLAAAIMAVAPWSIIISRDGFRAAMMALVVPLTLWLFTKAIQTNKQDWYIAAGVSLGAGFYTYIAFRLFPGVIILGFLYAWFWRRQQLRKWWPGLVTSVITMAIVLIPMGIYGVHHPDDLFARTAGVSITNPALNHGNLVGTFASNITKTALMFNFHGDENYRQNLGGAPELNVFVGIMFILGILVCLARLKKLRYFGVLAVFAVMLLPEILTAEGIPHALRSFGAMPATMVLAAIGISYMLDSWYGVFPRNMAARSFGTAAIAFLLLLTAYQGYVEYFVAWANSEPTYQAYSEDTTYLAAFYNDNPFNGIRYAVGGGYGMMPLQYLTHHKSTYTLVDSTQLGNVPLQSGVAKQFALEEGVKVGGLKVLEARFPGGRISPHYSNFNGDELFVVYTVPAT